MLAVGITGGIGSGKSYVCEIFAKIGIPIYNADFRARFIANESAQVKKQILTFFGSESYLNNELNRPFIASEVFNNPDKLNTLNRIIHPEVEKDYFNWLIKYKSFPYTLKEAAILFESGAYKKLDKTILVSADIDLRINRVMSRDNITKEAVLHRMKNQWPTEKIIPLTDFIIENNGKNLILPQIIDINEKLIRK